MAQPQQNISIAAPGFQGLNTEESPLQQDTSFCIRADNAVVDRYGRIGARKGFGAGISTFNLGTTVGASDVVIVHRLGSGNVAGTEELVCTVSLDLNGAGTTVTHYVCYMDEVGGEIVALTNGVTMVDDSTLDDARLVFFNDYCYIFSAGNPPLVWKGGASVTALSAESGYLGPEDDSGDLTASNELNGDVCAAAYGRLWVSGVDGDYQTIFYSDLLIPQYWYDGKASPTYPTNTAGVIDVSEYWPSGRDYIVNIKAHNNLLIVFGRQSILVFGNPQGDPAAVGGLYLADTISGIGLVNRDASCTTGADILFVDDTGVRSLGRTIQEQSAPIGDLTSNVRKDIAQAISETVDKTTISLSFWAEEALIVCLFSATQSAYVLEARAPSSTGGSKITYWTKCTFERALSREESGATQVYMGSNQSYGLLRYEGFLDHTGEAFEFSYQSNPMTLGAPTTQKFPKHIDYTVVSSTAVGTATARWGSSEKLEYSKQLTIPASVPFYWGVAEWGSAEYGAGNNTIKRYHVNAKGSGSFITVGIDADIQGNGFSLQEINIKLLLGRIY